MGTLKAGALFAGIGGFCLGFEEEGFRTAWVVENSRTAVQTYRHNFSSTKIIEDEGGPADIQKVEIRKHGLEPVDVLHAGFPCQSFSQAGNRKGFEDARGKLFYEIVRIVNEFKDRKPSVIVLENSPNIMRGAGGSWFHEITCQLRNAGYWFRETSCYELDTYKVTQLPQARRRLFMIALSRDKFQNSRIELRASIDNSEKDLGAYIDFEGELEEDYYYLPVQSRYHSMIMERKSNLRTIYQLRKYYVRVKKANVCPTLTANMGGGGHNVPFIFDKRGLRKLTERECLSLQGFPDWYEFPSSVSRLARYTHIGNAVAPPVAKIVACAVREKLESE